MGVDSLAGAISPGALLLLDSSILIAYFAGSEKVSPLAETIVDTFIRTGRNEAVISVVTAMEVLVRPLRLATGVDRPIVDFLRNFPHVRITPVDLEIAVAAASIRAAYRLSPPDALIVATGLSAAASCLVTNDEAWSRRLAPVTPSIDVCYVSEHL
jgi:predicted nucleic acid-binding protein